jgi:hypothetical protein
LSGGGAHCTPVCTGRFALDEDSDSTRILDDFGEPNMLATIKRNKARKPTRTQIARRGCSDQRHSFRRRRTRRQSTAMAVLAWSYLIIHCSLGTHILFHLLLGRLSRDTIHLRTNARQYIVFFLLLPPKRSKSAGSTATVRSPRVIDYTKHYSWYQASEIIGVPLTFTGISTDGFVIALESEARSGTSRLWRIHQAFGMHHPAQGCINILPYVSLRTASQLSILSSYIDAPLSQQTNTHSNRRCCSFPTLSREARILVRGLSRGRCSTSSRQLQLGEPFIAAHFSTRGYRYSSETHESVFEGEPNQRRGLNTDFMHWS